MTLKLMHAHTLEMVLLFGFVGEIVSICTFLIFRCMEKCIDLLGKDEYLTDSLKCAHGEGRMEYITLVLNSCQAQP